MYGPTQDHHGPWAISTLHTPRTTGTTCGPQAGAVTDTQDTSFSVPFETQIAAFDPGSWSCVKERNAKRNRLVPFINLVFKRRFQFSGFRNPRRLAGRLGPKPNSPYTRAPHARARARIDPRTGGTSERGMWRAWCGSSGAPRHLVCACSHVAPRANLTAPPLSKRRKNEETTSRSLSEYLKAAPGVT